MRKTGYAKAAQSQWQRQGRSKVAAQPRGAGNFSGFLPKAATGQNNRSGGWQSAAIFRHRQTLGDMEFWRLSAESRYGAQDTDPDFRAALWQRGGAAILLDLFRGLA